MADMWSKAVLFFLTSGWFISDFVPCGVLQKGLHALGQTCGRRWHIFLFAGTKWCNVLLLVDERLMTAYFKLRWVLALLLKLMFMQ